MWLPELLGLGDDEVQTTVKFAPDLIQYDVQQLLTVKPKVSEHVEPLDARKTRALTLENMKLTREVERLRGHQVSFLPESNHLKNQLNSNGDIKRERQSN